MKVAAILQSRMTSTRLPGKAMADLSGKPLTEWIIERAGRCKAIQEFVLAIPDEPADAPLGDRFSGTCTVYRGSLNDVLDRFYQAATLARADVIVRLTGDNPLLDPAVIDESIRQFLARDVDYGSTVDCPLGIGAEVFMMAALSRAYREATKEYQREHVTPYFYEQPGRFRCAEFDVKPLLYGLRKSQARLTVDTPEDLEVARAIYAKLASKKTDFGLKEISDLFAREPDVFAGNLKVRQKTYRESETAPQTSK